MKNNCPAFPQGEHAPEEWCRQNKHRQMCVNRRKLPCSTFGDGPDVSIYQQKKTRAAEKSKKAAPVAQQDDG